MTEVRILAREVPAVKALGAHIDVSITAEAVPLVTQLDALLSAKVGQLIPDHVSMAPDVIDLDYWFGHEVSNPDDEIQVFLG